MNTKTALPSMVLFTITSIWSLQVSAECGGRTQCIGIGPTEDDALHAHHGGDNKTPTFTFGSQGVATTSNPQTIYVAAVTGPTASQVTLGESTITGADASDFLITGGSCSPLNGPVHDGVSCTIEISFRPSTEGPKSATLHVPLDPPASPSTITERSANLMGEGGIVDLSSDIGAESLMTSQARTAKRFSRTQISNVHTRFDSLHRRNGASTRAQSNFYEGPFSDFELNTADRLQSSTRSDYEPMAALALSLATTISSGIFNLSYSNSASKQNSGGNGIGLWVEGSINFGTHEATGSIHSLTYTTDGISTGFDKKISDSITLGVAAGMANDRTKIGPNGSGSQGEANSFLTYGSFQMSQNLFLDILLGTGSLDYDLKRHVASTGEIAQGQRDGDQMIGSLAISYNYSEKSLLLSPYVRFDFSVNELDAYTETGIVENAVNYSNETLRSNQVSLGLRIESVHQTNFGWALPQLKIEWRENSDDDLESKLVYINQPASPTYTLNSVGEDSDSVIIGIGSDFIFHSGLDLSTHYSFSSGSNSGSDQAINFALRKDLDGAPYRPEFFSESLRHSPLRVEATYVQNNNLNRASLSSEELSDQLFTVGVSNRRTWILGQKSRVGFKGYLLADRWRRYSGLDKQSLGLKTSYQYRPSRAYNGTTYSLFADLTHDDYESELRCGNRTVIGISAHRAVTNKINIFGAIQGNKRGADDAVFDTRYDSLRLNFDYDLRRNGLVYLGLQLRNGDMVASTSVASYYNDIALASANEDAYTNKTLTTTRFKAETNILTLGYNLPVGQRDTLDFTWVKIDSKPEKNIGNVSYSASQISASYFMRF
ncbi:MAG: hypothetical protein ACI845_000993 [Gammaproteobacteria bacterium]|jgi:uncharacterized protein YhjY with autotransporter beta-barrel domain